MTVAWAILAAMNAIAWILPSPSDKFGWSLRVMPVDLCQQLLTYESIGHRQLKVALLNHAKTEQRYMPLDAASKTGDLEISLVRPSGKPFRSQRRPYSDKLIEERMILSPMHVASCEFTFRNLGYGKLPESGVWKVRATLKTHEGHIAAPDHLIKVIDPSSDSILTNLSVVLEGSQAKWPKEKHDRAVLEQIKIGDRTWLFYRHFLSPEGGGSVSAAFRIAELPGKVLDLKVEGAFGAGNPLTITYRETTFAKFTTTHVINSVDGRPWTAEEEKLRQERLKRDGKPAPPPDKE